MRFQKTSSGLGAAFMSRTARLLASVSLATALVAPAPAFATQLASDQIAGVPLRASGLAAQAPDINAAAGVVMSDDGRVLWARGASDRRAHASITKVMTALVVLEHASLDDVVTISPKAAGVDYAMGLQPGERRTVRELLQYALVVSSNDAAYALAEHVGGGSVPTFVMMMNRRAADLGLEGTSFANPHGLDAPGHYSTAEEVAALTSAAMKNRDFRKIVGVHSLTLTPYGSRAARTLKTTDRLLGAYPGLVGGKTGFTGDAGFSFVARSERNGIALTVVVLGAPSNASRFAEARELFDWGFTHLAVRPVAGTTAVVGAVPAAQDPAVTVPVRYGATAQLPLFDLAGPVERTFSFARVQLPVTSGQPLGEATLTQGGRTLVTLPVVAAIDVALPEETGAAAAAAAAGAVSPDSALVPASAPVGATGDSGSDPTAIDRMSDWFANVWEWFATSRFTVARPDGADARL